MGSNLMAPLGPTLRFQTSWACPTPGPERATGLEPIASLRSYGWKTAKPPSQQRVYNRPIQGLKRLESLSKPRKQGLRPPDSLSAAPILLENRPRGPSLAWQTRTRTAGLLVCKRQTRTPAAGLLVCKLPSCWKTSREAARSPGRQGLDPPDSLSANNRQGLRRVDSLLFRVRSRRQRREDRPCFP